MHDQLRKAISISQHCQRNWDLSQQVSKEDLDLILHAATNCTSKQNRRFYKIHVVTNRAILETVYALTETQPANPRINYPGSNLFNTQVLANVLLVFQMVDTSDEHKQNVRDHQSPECVQRDYYMSIGIASGYANLVATQLGYRTGYCACFDPKKVAIALGLPKSDFDILVTLGIGFPKENKKYWESHYEDAYNPMTYIKENIEVNYID